jgi:hypothetical protein
MASWNTSLWDFKLGELRQLVNTISNKSHLVSDAFANFREFPCFPRKFKQMTVQELSDSPDLILELWNSRGGMKAEATFKLECKPKVREKQLIDSLDEIYEIDTERARAKVVIGHYSDSQQTLH